MNKEKCKSLRDEAKALDLKAREISDEASEILKRYNAGHCRDKSLWDLWNLKYNEARELYNMATKKFDESIIVLFS